MILILKVTACFPICFKTHLVKVEHSLRRKVTLFKELLELSMATVSKSDIAWLPGVYHHSR